MRGVLAVVGALLVVLGIGWLGYMIGVSANVAPVAAAPVAYPAYGWGFGFPFFPFGNFGRDYDGTPPDFGQRRRDAVRSSPAPFFLPFFGGGRDERQEQESRAQRRPPRPVPQQQGGRQRYAEPPEYQERPRRNDDFFFGRRGGGF